MCRQVAFNLWWVRLGIVCCCLPGGLVKPHLAPLFGPLLVSFRSPFCSKSGPLLVPFLNILGPLLNWAQCISEINSKVCIPSSSHISFVSLAKPGQLSSTCCLYIILASVLSSRLLMSSTSIIFSFQILSFMFIRPVSQVREAEGVPCGPCKIRLKNHL